MSYATRLLIAIQDARDAGFTHLAAALIQMLRAELRTHQSENR